MTHAVNAHAANRGQTLKVERAVAAAAATSWPPTPNRRGRRPVRRTELFAAALRQEMPWTPFGHPHRGRGRDDPDLRRQRPARRASRARPAGSPYSRTPSVEDTIVATDARVGRRVDMRAIGADEAHPVTDGSHAPGRRPRLRHPGRRPDLAANIHHGLRRLPQRLRGPEPRVVGSRRPVTTAPTRPATSPPPEPSASSGSPDVRLSSVRLSTTPAYLPGGGDLRLHAGRGQTGAAVTNTVDYIYRGSLVRRRCRPARGETAVDRAVRSTPRAGAGRRRCGRQLRRRPGRQDRGRHDARTTDAVSRPINAGCSDSPAELNGVGDVSSTTRDRRRSRCPTRGSVIDVIRPRLSILSTITGGGYGRSRHPDWPPRTWPAWRPAEVHHPALSGTALTACCTPGQRRPVPDRTTTCTGTGRQTSTSARAWSTPWTPCTDRLSNRTGWGVPRPACAHLRSPAGQPCRPHRSRGCGAAAP